MVFMIETRIHLWNSYNNAAYKSLLSLLMCIGWFLVYLNHDLLTKLEDSDKFLRTRNSEKFWVVSPKEEV